MTSRLPSRPTASLRASFCTLNRVRSRLAQHELRWSMESCINECTANGTRTDGSLKARMLLAVAGISRHDQLIFDNRIDRTAEVIGSAHDVLRNSEGQREVATRRV